MVKDISTLVADIQGLFDGHSLQEVAVDRFSKELTLGLLDRFEKYREDRKPTLRMSNYGRPLRQLFYELRGYPREKLSSSIKFKFLFGDILELVLLLLAEEAGHTVSDMQREVSVDGVVGHLDCIIDGTTVVDVKSASTYSFNKFRDGSIRTNDAFGYIPQLAGYSKALGGLDGGFLVVDKTLGNIHFEKFTGQELSSLVDVSGKIAEDRAALASNDLPQRCYSDEPYQKSGNRKLSVPCQYCGWKTECWKDSNQGQGLKQYIYSTGPVWLTHVEREPKVFNANQKEETI